MRTTTIKRAAAENIYGLSTAAQDGSQRPFMKFFKTADKKGRYSWIVINSTGLLKFMGDAMLAYEYGSEGHDYKRFYKASNAARYIRTLKAERSGR